MRQRRKAARGSGTAAASGASSSFASPGGPAATPDGATAVLAVALVAALCYLPSLSNRFAFDDRSAIEENMDLRPTTPLATLFGNDFWGTPLRSNRSNKSYRPLTVLSFRLNYSLHQLEPFGYHLVNLILHSVVSVQILGLAKRLRPGLNQGALFAALLFACHPVHSEAVCNTVGRAELLAAALLLLSLQAYSAAATAAKPLPRALGWYTVACGAAICAALAKETGLLALVLGAAEDLLMQLQPADPPGSQLRKAVAVAGGVKAPAETQRWRLPSRGWWLRTAFSAGLTLSFLWDAQSRRGTRLTPAFSYVDNPISHGWQQLPSEDTLFGPPATPPLTRVLSAGYISAYYLWLLVWPLTLSPDYSYAAFPLVESYDDPRNVASALAAVSLLLAGVCAMLGRGGGRVGSTMAYLFVVLPLLPACQLFLPVGTVLGERLLYTPSIGYCLVFGWSCEGPPAICLCFACVVRESWSERLRVCAVSTSKESEDSSARGSSGRLSPGFLAAARHGFVLLVCCWYAALAFQQASVWYDDASLFQAAAIACPSSAKVHVTLGATAMRERNATAAEFHFAKALEIFPEYDDGLYSLGRLYFEGGVPGKEHLAAELLRRALDANPMNDVAWDYHGQLLARSGRLEEAELAMEQGVAASARGNLALMRNLGVVKRALGKLKEGEALISEAEQKQSR